MPKKFLTWKIKTKKMNSTLLANSIRFILLLAAQVLIFNNIDFFGFINPFPYILFIILYPVNGNKTGLLVASFFLGLLMDMFCNSGGRASEGDVVIPLA